MLFNDDFEENMLFMLLNEEEVEPSARLKRSRYRSLMEVLEDDEDEDKEHEGDEEYEDEEDEDDEDEEDEDEEHEDEEHEDEYEGYTDEEREQESSRFKRRRVEYDDYYASDD